jgi:non-ribosomal peptide synthetase component E (peptide arylation enzyme)
MKECRIKLQEITEARMKGCIIIHSKIEIIRIFCCQGHYDSMDEGIIDFSGCVSIMTRADDVINVAGHRLSTKAIEEVQFICLYYLKHE